MKAAGIDFYKDWLGIPEEHRPPDHYRLLGLEPFEEDGGRIEEAWLARTKTLRARQLDPRHGAVVQDLLNELAYAETVLTDRQKKRAYDEKLRSGVSLDDVDPDAGVVVDLAPYVVGGQARLGAVAARVDAGRRILRIACPQCGHENQKGKLVCRNCGGYLVAVPRRMSRFLGWDVPSWTWPVVAGVASVGIAIGLVFALLSAMPETLPIVPADTEENPPVPGGKNQGNAPGGGSKSTREPGAPSGSPPVRAAEGSFDPLFNRATERWSRVEPEPRSAEVLSGPIADIFLVPRGRTAVAAEDGSVVVWNAGRGFRFQAGALLRGKIGEIRFDSLEHVYISARWEPIVEFLSTASPPLHRLGPTASRASRQPIALSPGRGRILFLSAGETSSVRLRVIEYVEGRGTIYTTDMKPLPGVDRAVCAALQDDGRLAVASEKEVWLFMGTPPVCTARLPVPPGAAPAELAFDPQAGVAALFPPAARGGQPRIVWLEKPGEALLDTYLEGGFWFGPEPRGLLFARAKGNAVKIWFASQGEVRLLREFALPSGAVATAVTVDPEVPVLAVGLSDGRLVVWDRAGAFAFPPETLEILAGSEGAPEAGPSVGTSGPDPSEGAAASRGEADLHGTWTLEPDRMLKEYKRSEQYKNIPEHSRDEAEYVVRDLFSKTQLTFSEGTLRSNWGGTTQELGWKVVSMNGDRWTVEMRDRDDKPETMTLDWMNDDRVKLIPNEDSTEFTLWLVRKK